MAFWDTLFNKKPKSKPMVFPVGEGLNPEQTQKAQEVIATKPVEKPKSSFWNDIIAPKKAMEFRVGEGMTPEQTQRAEEVVRQPIVPDVKVDYPSAEKTVSNIYKSIKKQFTPREEAVPVRRAFEKEPIMTKAPPVVTGLADLGFLTLEAIPRAGATFYGELLAPDRKKGEVDIGIDARRLGYEDKKYPTAAQKFKNKVDAGENPWIAGLDVVSNKTLDVAFGAQIIAGLARLASRMLVTGAEQRILDKQTVDAFAKNQKQIFQSTKNLPATQREQVIAELINARKAAELRLATGGPPTAIDKARVAVGKYVEIASRQTPLGKGFVERFIKPDLKPSPTKLTPTPIAGELPGMRERPGQAPGVGLSLREMESVGGQGEVVYRGGEKFDKSKIGELGMSVTTDKRIAKSFAPATPTRGTGIVEEMIINPNAKIATEKDIPSNLWKRLNEKGTDGEKAVVSYAKEKGFDVIDFGEATGVPEKRIINPEVIKTKSQLEDIVKQATQAREQRLTEEGYIKPPHLKFDSTGRPLAYTAREKAILEKPKPLEGTPGEIRSIEIQAQQNADEMLSRNADKNITPRDVSIEEIIRKEQTPLKNKVNLIDYIRTPDRVLKKIGLEKEAGVLRSNYETYLKELPKNIDKITQWSKQVSPTGNKDIFRYLDGEAITLKPQDQRVADEIRSWLEDWAKKLKLPEDRKITHYITHIFDKQFLAKEFDEDLAKLIDNKLPGQVYDPFLEKRLGAQGYKQDTWAALDAYVKRATRKVNLDPALEQIKDASNKLEKSQMDYVTSYINSINMRPNKLDSLLDNGIKQLIGYRLGQRPTLAITRFLRQMTYRAMLGGNLSSALKNISQGINTYAKLGEKYTTIGYINLFKSGAKAELEAEGILNAGFIEDRALSSTKKILEKFDKTLFYFFETAEHINRSAAYFGAKAQGLSKGMSEKEAVEYGKKIVRDTQFTFGKIDTPLVLSSDIGKTIGQFQSFTTKQIEFLSEMAKAAVKGDQKAKNFFGLLRYAAAGTLFVSIIGKAFGMDIKDLIPSVRLGTPPSLKLPLETVKAIVNTPDKYNQPRDLNQKLKDIGNAAIGLIPGGIQGKKTIQGIEALNKGRVEDSSGRAKYDVGGSPIKNIQTVLFGKYVGQGARNYYDKDLNYAEQKLEQIRNSKTGKQDLLKIIKEEPTLAKNITQVLKDQAAGITDDDKKLKNMGVANKQRAREIAKQLNKLKTKEEKQALTATYIQKKIITPEVAAQLIEFLNK